MTFLGFNDSISRSPARPPIPRNAARGGSSCAVGRDGAVRRDLRGGDMIGRQVGRKAVLVFTDGEDQGSHVGIDDVERGWSRATSRYTDQTGTRSHPGNLKKIMERLTTKTGGSAFLTETIDELQRTFEDSSMSSRISIWWATSRPTPNATASGVKSGSR